MNLGTETEWSFIGYYITSLCYLLTLQEQVYNWPESRIVPQASAQGQGTARGVAKLYGMVANGGKYLFKNPKTVNIFNTPLISGRDEMMTFNVTYGFGLAHYYTEGNEVRE